MSKNLKKYVLSIILVLVSYGFIIHKIISFKEFTEFSFSIKYYLMHNIFIFLIVIILMIANWSVETIKWKMLIDKIQYLTFKRAIKSVFVGITVGIFTPNRIGEIGGRALFLEKGKRTYGMLAAGTGGFAQFITSITMGMLGFILFLILFPEKTHINFIFHYPSAILIILVLIILTLSYFNIKKVKLLLEKFSFFKRRTDQLEYMASTRSKSLLLILLLSIVRYFIFTFQFYLLLIIFDVSITLNEAFISISLIYLFSTLIPVTNLASLGIKGSLSIFFIGLFSDNMVGIILTLLVLWFINLAMPSVIGSLSLIKKSKYLTN